MTHGKQRKLSCFFILLQGAGSYHNGKQLFWKTHEHGENWPTYFLNLLFLLHMFILNPSLSEERYKNMNMICVMGWILISNPYKKVMLES